MGDRAGEKRRASCSLSYFYHLCFLLPPSSQQLLSTSPSSPFPSFIHALCPIASNAFQHPHSPAEHLKGRGRTWASASSSSSATAATHGCNGCGLGRCSPPAEAGEDWRKGSAPWVGLRRAVSGAAQELVRLPVDLSTRLCSRCFVGLF